MNAKDVSVVTTGGTFAVRAYKDDPAIIVRVKEGDVKVDGAKESRTVAAGKAVAVAKDGTMSEPRRRRGRRRRSAGPTARSSSRTRR